MDKAVFQSSILRLFPPNRSGQLGSFKGYHHILICFVPSRQSNCLVNYILSEKQEVQKLTGLLTVHTLAERLWLLSFL